MTDTPQGPGWWMATDGRWYPPQPAAPAKQQTNPWMILGWVVLGLLMIPCVGCGAVAAITALGSTVSTTTTTTTTVPVTLAPTTTVSIPG